MGPNRVHVLPSSHLKKETDPVSKMLCFLVFLNSRQWIKSRNPVILNVWEYVYDQLILASVIMLGLYPHHLRQIIPILHTSLFHLPWAQELILHNPINWHLEKKVTTGESALQELNSLHRLHLSGEDATEDITLLHSSWPLEWWPLLFCSFYMTSFISCKS
jgi:hypothetical protein